VEGVEVVVMAVVPVPAVGPVSTASGVGWQGGDGQDDDEREHEAAGSSGTSTSQPCSRSLWVLACSQKAHRKNSRCAGGEDTGEDRLHDLGPGCT
jgi:hypothetical protein